mmetsp:Transcript_14076/g.45077  ORF Transcript_14076/g.45077 Transcript_14076/m.45077 type:complete len:212 (-) Transcript_14076:34-669(-)
MCGGGARLPQLNPHDLWLLVSRTVAPIERPTRLRSTARRRGWLKHPSLDNVLQFWVQTRPQAQPSRHLSLSQRSDDALNLFSASLLDGHVSHMLESCDDLGAFVAGAQVEIRRSLIIDETRWWHTFTKDNAPSRTRRLGVADEDGSHNTIFELDDKRALRVPRCHAHWVPPLFAVSCSARPAVHVGPHVMPAQEEHCPLDASGAFLGRSTR